MLAVGIDNAWLRSRIGIDEETVLISIITRTFQITVTERNFDSFEGRNYTVVAFEFALTFFVSSFDSGTNLFYRFGIVLGDDQADAVLRRTAIDGFRFPNISVRPTSVDTSNYFARVYII